MTSREVVWFALQCLKKKSRGGTTQLFFNLVASGKGNAKISLQKRLQYINNKKYLKVNLTSVRPTSMF